jgi:hypothetical protein
MIRYLFAAASACLLVVASSFSNAAPTSASLSKTAGAQAAAVKNATPEIPREIRIPASAGDVLFRHQMHISDLGIKCVDCHHHINAKQVNTPHPDYFGSSRINCKTCHDGAQKATQKAYVCSECHQTRPKNIADETLSSKVVIHRQCWKCHAVGTGKEASSGCEKCHSDRKKS